MFPVWLRMLEAITALASVLAVAQNRDANMPGRLYE
jgi:hypothetical protein